jgi:hypothetical protein
MRTRRQLIQASRVYRKFTGVNRLVITNGIGDKIVSCKVTTGESQSTKDGIQRYNKDTATTGYYVSAADGTLVASAASVASDYISIVEGEKYVLLFDTTTRTNGGAFYTASKTFISGFTTAQANAGIIAPTNACFIRFSTNTTLYMLVMFCLYTYVSHVYESWTGNTGTGDFVKAGTPTISNNIASGFATDKYITSPKPFSPGTSNWEIRTKFTTGSDITTIQGILGTYPNDSLYSAYLWNGNFSVALSSNGTSWDMALTVVIGAAAINTTYYIKLVYNSTTGYVSYISTDGINWTSTTITTSTTPVYAGQKFSIGIDRVLTYYFKGSVDLNYTRVIIAGVEWWAPGKSFAAPSPSYSQTISGTGDKVLSTDADYDTVIQYGSTSLVGKTTLNAGVDVFRVPMSAKGINDITNGKNFIDTTGWGAGVCSVRATNSELELYGAASIGPNARWMTGKGKSGDKIYMRTVARGNVDTTSIAVNYRDVAAGITINIAQVTIGLTANQSISGIATLTADSNAGGIQIMFNHATTPTNSSFINMAMMINLTTCGLASRTLAELDAMDWEDYHVPQTLNLYLTAPLYAGDTISSRKQTGTDAAGQPVYDNTKGLVTRNKIKYVFTGNEIISTYTELANTYSFSFLLPDGVGWYLQTTYCSHLVRIYGGSTDAQGFFHGDASARVFLRLLKSLLPSANASDLKTWLAAQHAAGTPVIIVYKLATPTTEDITFPALPTYKRTTVISNDNTIPATATECVAATAW